MLFGEKLSTRQLASSDSFGFQHIVEQMYDLIPLMKKRIHRMLWAFQGQDDKGLYRLCWLYMYSCCLLARLPGVMTMESTKRKNLGAFNGVTDRVAWQGIRNQGVEGCRFDFDVKARKAVAVPDLPGNEFVSLRLDAELYNEIPAW